MIVIKGCNGVRISIAYTGDPLKQNIFGTIEFHHCLNVVLWMADDMKYLMAIHSLLKRPNVRFFFAKQSRVSCFLLCGDKKSRDISCSGFFYLLTVKDKPTG